MTGVDLSVVVCSFNGAGRISAVLDALTNQVLSSGRRFEVIVVDDGSTDGTAEVASRYPVKLCVQSPNQGLSAARNRGVAEASAPIVAFTDDDCVPPPDWVDRLISEWADAPPTVVGVGGVTHARDLDTLCRRYLAANNPLRPLELDLAHNTGLVARLRNYLAPVVPSALTRPVYSLVGANMSFRVDALTEISGFDPVIRFGGDEEDLCRRLRDRFGDGALRVVPDLSVGHDFEPSLADTLRRSRAYGRGAGREFARNGGLPSLQPLPFLAALLGAILIPLGLRIAAFVVVLLPAAVYRRLLAGARGRGFERLVYPYIAALQEISSNRGFVEGFWVTRRGGWLGGPRRRR